MNQRHMDWIPTEITRTSAYASENAAKICLESIKPNAEYFFKTCFEIPYVLEQTLEVDSFFLNLLCSLNDISSGRERSCNSAAVAVWFWDVQICVKVRVNMGMRRPEVGTECLHKLLFTIYVKARSLT